MQRIQGKVNFPTWISQVLTHCASSSLKSVGSRREVLWLWSCPIRWWITPDLWRSSLCLVSRDAVEHLMLFQDIFIIIIVIIIADINNSHVICKWIILSYMKKKTEMVNVYVGIIFHVNYWKATNHPEKKEQARKMDRVGSSQPCLLHRWDRCGLCWMKLSPLR